MALKAPDYVDMAYEIIFWFLVEKKLREIGSILSTYIHSLKYKLLSHKITFS